MKFVLIADDLTGANDSGVQLAKCGLKTSVLFQMDAQAAQEQDAVVLNTDSRSVSRAEAYWRVKKASAFVQPLSPDIVYKKIDSTLRGNIGAEIDAVYDTFQPDLVIIAPAYPQNGRKIVNGFHYLHGRLLHETEIAVDPKTPVTESFLPKLLQEQTSRRVALITCSELREGAVAAADKLIGLRESAVPYVVFDSETEEDLLLIVEAVSRSGCRVVWTGSAGLAYHLAVSLSHPVPAATLVAAATASTVNTVYTNYTTKATSHLQDRSVLVVMGSVSARARRQLEELLIQSDMEGVQIQSDLLVSDQMTRKREIERVCELASQVLNRKMSLALYSSAGQDDMAKTKQAGRFHGMEPAQIGDSIAAALGEVAGRLLERFEVDGIVMTGGDTAGHICQRLGAARFELIDEVEGGVPFGKLFGRKELYAVTKAGSFGSEHVLIHAVTRLKGVNDIMKPIIGITMGDAAGVGPEVIVKSLFRPEVYEICRPLVIGDAKLLERAISIVSVPLTVRRIANANEAVFHRNVIDCIDLDLLEPDLPFGQISAAAGDAAYQYIAKAVELAQNGDIDAICTAPLNKEALHKGGHLFPGHTEILAYLTDTVEYSMMLTTPKLKVIHLTTHVGLLKAIEMITPERTYTVIKLAHDTLTKAGYENPSIAVCGINPHAGENGLFGNGEEAEKLIPGIEKARAEGINATGPYPADTLFFRAARGDFQMVVACYHDQGHAPVKVLGIEAGVNITVGLKGGIIRTSVDHGTAFDIAGKNIADERSLMEAIRAAAELAPKR